MGGLAFALDLYIVMHYDRLKADPVFVTVSVIIV